MRLLKKVLRIILWPLRLWRLALAGVLLLAAAQVIADQVLLRKLAAQMEEFRSEGMPVSYADLRLPEYTAIGNANTVYEQAMDMIKKEPEELSWTRHSLLIGRYVPTNPQVPRKSDDPLSEDELRQLGEYFQGIQPVFDLLRTSRDCGICIIPDFLAEIYDTGGDGKEHAVYLPSLARMRELTRYAAARGLWECRRGNTDEGFDWFVTGLNIVNNHSAHPTLIGGLSRIGCLASVLGAVQSALYDGDVPAVLPAAFSAELEKCRDRGVYCQTLESERLYSNEASVRMGFQAWRILRPMFSLDQLKRNQLYRELADSFRSSDFAAQESKMGELHLWAEKASGIYIMTKILVPAWLRSVESMRRSLASAEMCDIAIKLKQYKRQNGAYPDSLAALGQTTLPMDPFSGSAFKYRREGEGFQLASAGKKILSADKKTIEINVGWNTAK